MNFPNRTKDTWQTFVRDNKPSSPFPFGKSPFLFNFKGSTAIFPVLFVKGNMKGENENSERHQKEEHSADWK